MNPDEDSYIQSNLGAKLALFADSNPPSGRSFRSLTAFGRIFFPRRTAHEDFLISEIVAVLDSIVRKGDGVRQTPGKFLKSLLEVERALVSNKEIKMTGDQTSKKVSSLSNAIAASVIFMTMSACSTLVGNVKPVDEKSRDYGILDLANENPAVWKKLSEGQLQPKDAQIGTNKQAF